MHARLTTVTWSSRFLLLALLSCVLVWAEQGSATDFLVRNWDLEAGLPSTCINAALRTPDGYLWLGTQHGLARFDGMRFEVFTTENTPALNDNRITSLALEPSGVLWAGMRNGGLAKIEGHRFTRVDLKNVQNGGGIFSLATGDDGILWVGMEFAGLVRIKDGHTETFAESGELPPGRILQLVPDESGRLWYLGGSDQVGWIEENQCHPLEVSGVLPDSIRVIAGARDGGLWLATTKQNDAGTRLFKFSDGKVTEVTQSYPWKQSSARSRIGTLMEDREGNLWCGTLGEGVFIWTSTGEWQRVCEGQPVSQAEVLCLTPDEGESVLIGTRTSGLHQAVPRPLTRYFLPYGHDQEVLRTVCVRQDGSVWSGTDGAGVFRWLNGKVVQYAKEQGLAGLHINSIMEDARSNLWVGTRTGLFQYEPDRFTAMTNPSLSGNITVLHEDRQGKMWAGTANGLIGIGGNPDKFDQGSGLPRGQIAAFLEDASGQYWVAIDKVGLFRQSGKQFQRWIPQTGTPDALNRWRNVGYIKALAPDQDGAIWVATYGYGLFYLKGDFIRRWGWGSEGLPSNHLFTLLEDNAGLLWCSSENAIFGYPKRSLLDYNPDAGSPPVPFRLTIADGLPYKVCSGGGQPTACKSPDGRLWFPDGPALVAFDPQDVPRNFKVWSPIVEEVRVDGVPLSAPGSNFIQIESGARSFEFRFTSPNLLSPDRLRFRYRLEGVDKDWVAEGSERSVRYGQLPPGNYQFRVMTRSSAETWNEAVAETSLTVTPRFWETNSFQLGVGVLLLGVVAVVVHRRERARTQRKLTVMEHERVLERERGRIARDIHDDLGASLTQVSLLGDLAGRTSNNPDELRDQTRQISAVASDMAQSLEAIVWAVRPENDTLQSLVEFIGRRTDELFEKMPRRYQFTVADGLPNCSVHAEVRHNVFLAYKEALTNSLKHSQATNVRINIQFDTETCWITIVDDGKGFDLESVRVGGTGLKNIRVRLEEIGGGAELKTKPDQGTTIKLRFPLKQDGKL